MSQTTKEQIDALKQDEGYWERQCRIAQHRHGAFRPPRVLSLNEQTKRCAENQSPGG